MATDDPSAQPPPGASLPAIMANLFHVSFLPDGSARIVFAEKVGDMIVDRVRVAMVQSDAIGLAELIERVRAQHSGEGLTKN